MTIAKRRYGQLDASVRYAGIKKLMHDDGFGNILVAVVVGRLVHLRRREVAAPCSLADRRPLVSILARRLHAGLQTRSAPGSETLPSRQNRLQTEALFSRRDFRGDEHFDEHRDHGGVELRAGVAA